MQLSNEGLLNKKEYTDKGYSLPAFDRESMLKETSTNPEWIHFGAGNIFRAFQANVVQNLLNSGVLKSGLIVAEGFDYEIIEKMYLPHDSLSILVTLKSNGNIEKTVVGSIAESLILDRSNTADMTRLQEIFEAPSLKMASFTITEKGYSLVNAKGDILEPIQADFLKGPSRTESYMGKVASLLYTRYQKNALPIAMVSMDNCSHNGEKLYAAIHAFAKNWVNNGVCEEGFLSYVEDASKVSFPWTMIDKITPRPDAKVEALLREDALEGLDPVITGKNTYVAPFVNAEECEYLVIEDLFPNGKLPLEKGGIIYTDRETVNKVEKMKVCTCLNPLHTALAIYGCLLGYTLIADEMKDPTLKKMVEIIGHVEGMPVVVNPGIIDPEKFLDEVLNIRVPNPFMPDAPQRIATDTSQKLPIRFGETIKAYLADPNKNIHDLRLIPLVYAGWLRYLMAVDDNGEAFERSSDPLLASVSPYVEEFKLGANLSYEHAENSLKPLLKKSEIWGVDLYEADLAQTVIEYFLELTKGPGSVRNTLNKYVI